MFSHGQLVIYNTFRVTALICHSGIYPRIISRRHTYNCFKKFFSKICILYHEGNHTLVHELVHRVYSAVPGIQFACMHNPSLIPGMYTYVCKLLCTCLVHTRKR